MNIATSIAIAAIAVAIVVPLVLHVRKRLMGRVWIDFSDKSLDPEQPITGTVAVRFAKAGTYGPVSVVFRCSERLDGNGQLNSGVRFEQTLLLRDSSAFIAGQKQEFGFSFRLPNDPGNIGRTKFATRGSMPSALRRDYDWWCIAEVETPNKVTFRSIERLPLTAR